MHKFVEFAKTSMKFCNYEHTGSRSITLITGIDICVVVDTLRLGGLATDIYALKLTSTYLYVELDIARLSQIFKEKRESLIQSFF